MIERASEQLESWIRETLDLGAVSFAPPGDMQGRQGINCYLLELVENPPVQGSKRAPLQFALHYLVTCWAETPLGAQRLLSALIVAVMQHEQYEALLKPVAAETWTALGTIPRPSFLLRVPVRMERATPVVPRVRSPIDVDSAPMTQFFGVVVGPGDIPLAGARVELPSLQRVTRTDAKGRFQLTGMAGEPRTTQLRISAKGKSLDMVVEQPATVGHALVIHFDLSD